MNLEKGSAFDGPRPIILNGRPKDGYSVRTEAVTLRKLEDLYSTYKTSVPDGITPKNQYFHANGYGELTREQLRTGANRQKAREALEMARLEGVMNGSLRWPDPSAWFWQSKRDPDFILLRKWIDTPWKGVCQCRQRQCDMAGALRTNA